MSEIPDQDMFYDVTDCLEEQGIEKIIKKHMNKNGNDVDLVLQMQLYENALKKEDGEDVSVSDNQETIRLV